MQFWICCFQFHYFSVCCPLKVLEEKSLQGLRLVKSGVQHHQLQKDKHVKNIQTENVTPQLQCRAML
jgi:hypothetical protein